MIVLSDSRANPDEEYEALVLQGKLAKTKVDLPVGHLSVSQVNMWLRCGRAYRFRYCDGIVGPPKAAMAEGKTMHRALEVGQREHMKTATMPPLDIMLDAYSDSWKIESADVETYEDASEKIILKRNRIFLTEYHKRVMPYTKPLAVEKRLWISTKNLHVPVLGYIDLVAKDDRPRDPHAPVMPQEEVIDYKVMGKTASRAEIDNSLQLTTYTYATRLPAARYDMFIKTKSPKLATIRTTRTAKDWKWAETIFEEVAKAIAAGIFPPGSPEGWWCQKKWCYYWDLCGRGK